MTDKTEKKLTQGDLDGFYGSEERYRSFIGPIFTPGVKFLADRLEAYWLIDAISSHLVDPQSRAKISEACGENELNFWKLLKTGESTAKLICQRDSGDPYCVEQDIEYTDIWTKFNGVEIDIWVGFDWIPDASKDSGYRAIPVLYLPSEH